MEKGKVVIILVNWNTYDYSRQCIEQLQQQYYSNVDILLVDNGSTDGSGEKLRKAYPKAVYFQNVDNLGFTGGNNVAMEYAKTQGYDYVLLLNNDTFLEPDFLEKLVLAMEADSRLGAVQPLIFNHPEREKVWKSGGDFITTIASTISSSSIGSGVFNTQWLTGCALMIRGEVLEKIGPLTPSYFAYFEDVDYSFRIRKAGYDLGVVTESKIYHIASGSTKSKTKQKEGFLSPSAHYLNVRNQIFLMRQHQDLFSRYTAFPFQTAKMFAYMGYFLLRNRKEKFKSVWRGLLDGYKLDPNSPVPLKP
ncbi:glycosyltransferase family 2 protein [Litoribacter alkaliphilus]|uniref:Glycosyltransferase family 2 protein n=1 Tax=Litoribacter ruber TaxID=702568 RepID=A0AAP2CGV5_9BACT|nr:glycosyltransferase family 2 protein [Litoribacter alkaliphilus]MBS9523449.1 glycosyltransferase family 2 protein [Litoribacter alkaliphilus]